MIVVHVFVNKRLIIIMIIVIIGLIAAIFKLAVYSTMEKISFQ